jgi:hypothetical protein
LAYPCRTHCGATYCALAASATNQQKKKKKKNKNHDSRAH